jgi:hypothetical protein
VLNTFDFVSSACAYIRENGYTNGRDAETQGIRSTGKSVLADILESDGEVPSGYGVTEDDEQTAQDALDWIRDMPEDERSTGYLRSLHKVASEPTVSFKSANMLASLPRTFCDHLDRAENAQDYSSSEFVGTVGERHMTTGTVREIRTGIRNKWNPGKPSNLIHFTDGKGNLLVWFTSKAVTVSVGDDVLIEGKVKRHETRDGIDQTQI